jgi:hypothetical protein
LIEERIHRPFAGKGQGATIDLTSKIPLITILRRQHYGNVS